MLFAHRHIIICGIMSMLAVFTCRSYLIIEKMKVFSQLNASSLFFYILATIPFKVKSAVFFTELCYTV